MDQLRSVFEWHEAGYTVRLSQRGWPKGRNQQGHDTYSEDQCYVQSPFPPGIRHMSSVPDSVAQDVLDRALADYHDRHDPIDEYQF